MAVEPNLKAWELVDRGVNHQLSVPEFQRGFVWKPIQVRDLAESLWLDYPVGSLLIWNSRGSVEERIASDAHGAKTLYERTKSVANRLLHDLGLARAGRDIGRVFADARGKGNSDALIILMNLEVNAAMDIPEGRRKDPPTEKLRGTYERLDAIGDALVQKIRTAIAQKQAER